MTRLVAMLIPVTALLLGVWIGENPSMFSPNGTSNLTYWKDHAIGVLPARGEVGTATPLIHSSGLVLLEYCVLPTIDSLCGVLKWNATNNLQFAARQDAMRALVLKGKIYYVATTGSDATSGTKARPFRTIAHGVSVLAPGDTLYVMSGTYAESLINNIPGGTSWSRPVTVAAAPGHTVVLKPNPGAMWALHFQGPQQHIVIDGLIIDATNVTSEAVNITSGPGTIATAAHHIRIHNCEIKNSQGNGIYVKWGYANELINLDIHHNGRNSLDHGIYLATDSKENLIERSRVYSNAGYGIHFWSNYGGIDNNIVRGNQVYDNAERGIVLNSGNGNIVHNNIVWGNRRGGIMINHGVAATNTGVYNNTLYANGQFGIYVGARSTGAIIRNNILFQNGSGIIDAGAKTVSDHNFVDMIPSL